MTISAKGRYGLRAMVDIAINSDNSTKYVTAKSIADRQEISISYLEQIISNLKKYGFLKSVRGSQGGYLIVGDPQNIKVGDILRAMEGHLQISDCVSNLNKCDFSERCFCSAKGLIEKMQLSIDEVVDSVTLQDLVDDHNRLKNL